MSAPKRQKRVSDSIHRLVSELLLRNIKDPRVLNITITEVEITADLRQATVWYSFMGDKEEAREAQAGLESATGYLRSQVGAQLSLFYTPELIFKIDKSWERTVRVEELLQQIALEREADEHPDPTPDANS